jgi:hypothetical protein
MIGNYSVSSLSEEVSVGMCSSFSCSANWDVPRGLTSSKSILSLLLVLTWTKISGVLNSCVPLRFTRVKGDYSFEADSTINLQSILELSV